MKNIRLSEKSIKVIYWVLWEARINLERTLFDRRLITRENKLNKKRKHYSEWEEDVLMQYQDLTRLEGILSNKFKGDSV